jgi:hypothetical protein
MNFLKKVNRMKKYLKTYEEPDQLTINEYEPGQGKNINY